MRGTGCCGLVHMVVFGQRWEFFFNLNDSMTLWYPVFYLILKKKLFLVCLLLLWRVDERKRACRGSGGWRTQAHLLHTELAWALPAPSGCLWFPAPWLGQLLCAGVGLMLTLGLGLVPAGRVLLQPMGGSGEKDPGCPGEAVPTECRIWEWQLASSWF